MSFSMSGGAFSHNRFDKFEAALSEAKGYQEGGEVKDCEDGSCGKCSKCKKDSKKKKSSGAKPDFLDVDKDGDKEEDMKDAIEDNGGAVSEAVKVLDELNKSTLGSYVKKASKDLGDRRLDQGESEKRQYEPDAEDEKEDKKLANREKGISKAVDKMLKKEEVVAEESGAELQARLIAGHKQKRAPKKGTKAHDKYWDKEEAAMKKEELEATGLFTAEELQQIDEVLGLGKKLSPEAKAQKDREKKLKEAERIAKQLSHPFSDVANTGKVKRATLKKEGFSDEEIDALMEMTEDELRDRRQERGGVDGNVDYKRAPKPQFTKGPKKKYDGMSALDFVKKDIEKKYGKGAILDTSKKKSDK